MATSDPNTYSSDDLLQPDSDSRADMALHTAGALCNPQDVIPDYEHYDGDYSANQQAQSWEHTDVDSTDRDYVFYDPDLVEE
ncbi:MAG: hypothetical protein HC781_18160 [Leptolyngbyaceae cyanobacterium CSU_1_4]|nr:hypothetical protein [Leptolyngbyaceae cyanobacterium CSU_1_4]